MPNVISLELAAIWFCVGLCAGAGWTLGAWIVTKILTPRPRA